ncbi:MAG TPA: DUF4012 domain-containing protein [Chloroflexia bacterium]|nr:DUF4012 domain-containing protein [Chloroflexia bacterium]
MLEEKSARPSSTIDSPTASPPPAAKGRVRKAARKKRRFWPVLLVLLAFILLAGLSGYLTFKTVIQYIESGERHLQALTGQLQSENPSLSSANLETVRKELASAQSDFEKARQSLGLWEYPLPLAGVLPGPGYDAAHLTTLLEIAAKTAQAGEQVMEGVQPALASFDPSAPTPDSQNSTGKLLLASQALAKPDAQARFGRAEQLLSEISALRAGLEAQRLNLDPARKALTMLDRYLPDLKQGVELARELPPVLPALLGANQPVTYLALMQNSDELRATGGFISSTALVTLDRGKFSLSGFQDSYAVDNPKVQPEPPVAALNRYMQAQFLAVRDANWWPDFPTSARKVADLYQRQAGRSADSVIALDSQAVSYLFEALGPLDLPAYNERLTAQNFEERLRYYYLPPGTDTQSGDWWLKRKEFVGVAIKGLFDHIAKAEPKEYLRLVEWMGRAISEKHLQLYFNQPEAEALLSRYKLDGGQTQAPPGQDYLMVVDSNVGFNKVSPKVDRAISYSAVAPAAGSSIFASLTLTYTNRAGVRSGTQPGQCVKVAKYDQSYESMMNGCYWDYLRVYVPTGSHLSRVSGDYQPDDYPAVLEENGRTVFATQLVIPPGQTVKLTFEYTLPFQLVSARDYNLLVQKQAGAAPAPEHLKLELAGESGEWDLLLTKDMEYNLKLVTKLLLTLKI